MAGSSTLTFGRPEQDQTERISQDVPGEVRVAPTVVEKIARRAAGEVDGIEVVATGIRSLFGSGSATAGTTADVDRETATVELSVKVRYPLPIASTTERLRRHVARRVFELAGRTVTEVDIRVVELHVDAAPRRRVV